LERFLLNRRVRRTNRTYYHGTAIPDLKVILPPIETNMLREDCRHGFLDCVFVTPLKRSAEAYARKCASKFGGTPIVYEVGPVNPAEINVSQYICDKAFVVNTYEVA
jgi:hypothetical protein